MGKLPALGCVWAYMKGAPGSLNCRGLHPTAKEPPPNAGSMADSYIDAGSGYLQWSMCIRRPALEKYAPHLGQRWVRRWFPLADLVHGVICHSWTCCISSVRQRGYFLEFT